jgi:hypothetical protein
MKKNIISISGRIGSGKDTVGKIIQYLCYTNNNRMSYESFCLLEDKWYNSDNWEIKKFAGKLKQIASMLTGVPVEMFENQEFKKQEMPECWNKLYWNDPDPIEGNDYLITERIQYEDETSLIIYGGGSEAEVFDSEIVSKPMTYREFLQKLGTEAMRDELHTNVWVNALFADYKVIDRRTMQDPDDSNINYPNWIITDTRFPNELEAVKKRNGITIKVIRPDYIENTFTGKKFPVKVHQTLHPSETAINDAEFDYEIINNGSIKELIEKVRSILINEQIL